MSLPNFLLYGANLLAPDFPPNDPIGCHSTLDHSSINTQWTTIIFIRLLLSTTLLPRSENLFHRHPINILEKFKDFPSTTRKYSDFFACRIVLAAKHQYSGNIQRLSEQPATAINSSNQQQQPATATSNRQRQPATGNSNQQQQPAAATSRNNQQQQSTAATTSSNQHSSYQQRLHNQRRPPLVINTVPSRGYPASS